MDHANAERVAAKRIRDNAIGAALCGVAFVLMVLVSTTGDDPVGVQHAVILFLDAVGAAWFTCGAFTAIHKRERRP